MHYNIVMRQTTTFPARLDTNIAMLISHSTAAAQVAAVVCTILLSDPNQVVHINQSSRRLELCNPKSNCVSSNYREPPNRYISPFRIVNEPDVAFQRAVRGLKNGDGTTSIVDIVPKDYYIHITVPGTYPSSLDDIELVFAPEVVNVKCEARVTLPPPPFCVKKNCINGNMDQRARVERLGRVLGLPPNDMEEMNGEAKWTPIFLNSDRVPGFEDYY